MARRSRPASAITTQSSKRFAAIDAAFNAAVGYHAPVASTSASILQEAEPASRRRRGKRAVVPDDEEEGEGEMEMVASTHGTEQATGGFMAAEEGQDGAMQVDPLPGAAGGGFMLPEEEAGSRPTPAGGFFAEDDGAGAGSGGRFLPEDTGGGFLPDPYGSGGFLPDDSTPGGGFLPDLPPMHEYSTPGGFLPDDLSLPNLPTAPGGGFFPDPSPDSLALPTPAPLANPVPPPDRIPLASIPLALRALDVPRGSEREVMALFEEVASDDETAEGGKSVRRERFREALAVLLGDDDDADEEEEEASEGGQNEEDGDEYRGEDDAPPTRRRRSTRAATRRSTRANPAQDDEDDEIREVDFADAGALPSSDESASASSFSSSTSSRPRTQSNKSKGKSPKSSTKSKKPRVKHDPSMPVSAQALAAASDSFDLFFEDSPQLALPPRERVLGLAELQRACRVLKEKMGDDELHEMLEYAARSKGVVDLQGFARILIETNL
ncbi:hypothetical protein JCM21900_006756 [Sporobolomyces salmonicolor]